MKKTILLSSIFAVGAAFAAATVDSPNVIGTLPVEVSTGQQLMAAPFADSDGTIAVNDMVKTANLSQDDALYVAKPDGYEKWTFDAENRKWVQAKKVTIGANGVVTEGEALSATEVKINRGDAFWLKTAKGGDVTLLGSKSDADPSVAEAGKWNLVGNTSLSPVTIQDNKPFDGLSTNDKLVLPQADGTLMTYTYKANKGWRIPDGNGGWIVASNLSIAAGKGCWLKTKETVTIAW